MDRTVRWESARPLMGFILLIALLALGAGGKAVLYDTVDPDCFWHLRVAEQLHRDGIGPIVDDLSFASSSKPWTPYSWLAELGMKAVWDVGGYRAAVFVQALMQGMIVVFLALCCLEMQNASPRRQSAKIAKKEENLSEVSLADLAAWRLGGEFERGSKEGQRTPGYLSAAVATAAGTFLALPYLSFRPVTAGFVLLSICAWLILRDRRMEERSWAVWLIVPLTLLLTNIHLFAFFVPGVVFLMLMGAAWERVCFLGNGGDSTLSDNPACGHAGLNGGRREVVRYGVMLVLVTLAYLGTPMLPGLIRALFFYGARDEMVRGPVIAEMQSFAKGPMGIAAGVIVGIAFICMILRARRLRVAEMGCFVIAGILLFKLGRFAPVFALVMCPVLAATGPALRDRILGKRPIWVLLAVVLVIGSVRIAGAFPRSDRTLSAWLNRNGIDAPGYPCEAARFVERNVNVSTGRVINEFSWGGYLAYALGDKYKILLDGRTQVYPAGLWRATYLSGESERARFLSTVRADAAVLPAGKSQFRTALTNLGWTVAYRDARAEVMLPPGGVARIEP